MHRALVMWPGRGMAPRPMRASSAARLATMAPCILQPARKDDDVVKGGSTRDPEPLATRHSRRLTRSKSPEAGGLPAHKSGPG